MKHMSLIFVFAVMAFVTGCQESSTKKSSSNSQYNSQCNMYPAMQGCPMYCTYVPNGVGCSGTTAGTTSGSTTAGTNGTTNAGTTSGSTTGTNPYINPYMNRPSSYVEKNWQVKYPYAPTINCSTPTTPSGVSYTPYETRKGTVTVVGAGFGTGKNPADPKAWYDPNTYISLGSDDNTSEMLRTKAGAVNFFYSDAVLKVRFKANLQPDSSNGNPVCYGRVSSQAWIKGYSKIKFNLYLVGIRADGSEVEELLKQDYVVEIQKCTTPIDLSNYNGVNYLSKYPDGVYLKVKYVKGNQNWSPSYYPDYREEIAWDYWGFYSRTQSTTGQGNPYYNGDSYMQAIRSNDCWSLDIEVAADGTKTF